MNRMFSKLLLGVLAAGLMIGLQPVITKAATTSTYVKVAQDNLPVYDNRSGSLVAVGYLTKNQTFKIVRDYGPNWWEINFGGHDGFIGKKQTVIASGASYKNMNTKYVHSKVTIKIWQDAPVYDNTSGSLVQFATIKAGQNYPVLYKYNSHFSAVDVDGRIGYVGVKYSTLAGFISETLPNTVSSEVSNVRADDITSSSALVTWTPSESANVTAYQIYNGSTLMATVPATASCYLLTPLDQSTTYRFKIKSVDSAWNVSPGVGISFTTLSGKLYIKAITDAPLYDNRTGNLDEIATLNSGQELEIVKDYSNQFWQVKWGNTFAYVDKTAVQTANTANFSNVDTYVTTNQNIITQADDIPVYDNTDGELVPFATLISNHRYPVISESNGFYMIDIGGRFGFVSEQNVSWDRGIPVLLYHHILDQQDLGSWAGVSTTVTTEQFQAEMDDLHQQGYTTVTTGDVTKFVNGEINLPGKTVAITFDDGLLSVKENAYPILKQYGMKATEFIITGRTNHPSQDFDPTILQSFSQEDMAAMTDVFDYQSHTNNMHNLVNHTSDVVTQPYEVVKADIELSKNILHADSFAYPFGIYNASTIQMLKELGFTSAYTTAPGYVNEGDDPFQLNRFIIDQKTSLVKFEQIVGYDKP